MAIMVSLRLILTTVREIASVFKVSKSTVHVDLTDRLYKVDKILHNKVRKILNEHRKEAPLRAAQASTLSRQIKGEN